MKRLALGLVVAALALGVGACGSGGRIYPAVARVPLVRGARSVVRVSECDRGANPYCAIMFVVYDRQYASPVELLTSERAYLHAHGWTGADGPVGPESAADSPGHKLHLTYATAGDELFSLEQHWVTRPWPVWVALYRSLFQRTAALAMVLEVGAGAT